MMEHNTQVRVFMPLALLCEREVESPVVYSYVERPAIVKVYRCPSTFSLSNMNEMNESMSPPSFTCTIFTQCISELPFLQPFMVVIWITRTRQSDRCLYTTENSFHWSPLTCICCYCTAVQYRILSRCAWPAINPESKSFSQSIKFPNFSGLISPNL